MDNYREKIVRIVERELKRTEEYQQRRDEYGNEAVSYTHLCLCRCVSFRTNGRMWPSRRAIRRFWLPAAATIDVYKRQRYGVLFYPIVNKVEKTGTVEIMAKAKDAKQINRIFERMGYPAPVKERCV